MNPEDFTNTDDPINQENLDVLALLEEIDPDYNLDLQKLKDVFDSMTKNKIEKRRFVYKDQTSNKFWNVTVDHTSRTYEVTWGKAGTKGTTRTYGPMSRARLTNEVNKKAVLKLRKGYKEVTRKAKKVSPQPEEQSITGEDLIYELDF